MIQYWLVKQEPDGYSWDDFVREKRTAWTGVRNYQARNNLRSMRVGDRVLFYHTGDVRAVVGIAKVAREAYPDPTAEDPQWVCVDLVPEKPLPRAVTLSEIKANAKISSIALVRQSRLTVLPLSLAEFEAILEMA